MRHSILLYLLIGVSVVWVGLLFPCLLQAQVDPLASATSEEITAYSSLIERFANQNWKGTDQERQYKVTFLEVTKRERIDPLKGRYTYCWVMLEWGREISEYVASFWQPDQPIDPDKPLELMGIWQIGKKSTL